MTEEAEQTSFCNLCSPPHRIKTVDFSEHMRIVHNINLDEVIEKWPDGEPVIVDTTLEPDDFNE